MNKKLHAAFSQSGIAFEHNTGHGIFEKGVGYGVVHGFETNVVFSNLNPIVFHFSCFATDEQRRDILNTLVGAKIKFAQFAFDKFGLGFAINDWTAGTLAKRLVAVLDKICDTLTTFGALGIGFCPVCGNALDFSQCKKCLIEGMSITIDNDCVNDINLLIDEENSAIEAAPNNYLRGFAGAFLGGLVGVALCALFYVIGVISGLSAFVAFFLGELLYKKFGGKQNAAMVVILSGTVFAMMLAAVLGTYLVDAAIGAKEVGMSTLGYFRECMQDEEIFRGFILDLVLTIIFSVLGCAYEIYMLCKGVQKQKNI